MRSLLVICRSFVLVGCFIVAWVPTPAGACSCRPEPTAFVVLGEGTIPANSRGIAVTTDYDEIEWELYRVVGDEMEPVASRTEELAAPDPFGVWVWDLIVPEMGFVPGDKYSVVGGPSAELKRTELYRKRLTVLFEVGEAAILPRTLGTLATQESSGPLELGFPSTACFRESEASQIHVSLEPSPEAEPWMNAFVFATLVDGGPWRARHSTCQVVPPGSSWEGRGVDLLYTDCGGFPHLDLAKGSHRVSMVAWLPGTSIVLKSEQVRFRLKCKWWHW